jgi:hypothetical protein
MDEDKYCMDLHNGGYKQHTKEWKAIPEGVMKNSKMFTTDDQPYILDILEDITTEMAMNPAKMDKDKWIKIFIETKEISAARNKKRFIRILWSLVRTDQKELFETLSTATNSWKLKSPLFQQPTLSMVPLAQRNHLGKERMPTNYQTCTQSEVKNASI